MGHQKWPIFIGQWKIIPRFGMQFIKGSHKWNRPKPKATKAQLS